MLSGGHEASPGDFSPVDEAKRNQQPTGPRTATSVPQAGSEAPRQGRAPSPRRRTGFPGIGPLEVSPNVILFVPRRTPLGTPGANEPIPVRTVSPDRAAIQRAGDTPEEERLCLRTWALCIATMGPFILSFWMMALPLLVRTNRTTELPPLLPVPAVPVTNPTATAATTTSRDASITSNVATTTSNVTTPAHIGTTIFSPSCFERSPNLTDLLGQLTLPAKFTPLSQTVVRKPFFCLFNNTRFLHPRIRDFAFETLPFQLCPHIIYWSVGVENGAITSRVPRFDQRYGLERLRATVDNRGFSSALILLALGGYQEDAPHFSMLGTDRGLLETFIRNVVNVTTRYRLDGITVHWVPARPGCEGPNDSQTLEDILRGLQTWVRRRGLPPVTLSVILPAKDEHVEFANRVASVVDYFFLDTRTIAPTTTLLKSLCSSVTTGFQSAVVGFVRRSGGGLDRDQVCIMDSLAPLSGPASFNFFTGIYDLNVSSTSQLKQSPFYDFCRNYRFCRENATDSCVVHRSHSLIVRDRVTLYIVNSPSTWMERTSYRHLYGESSDKNICILIADLDYDDYSKNCGTPYEQYILMMNFYFGAYGATGRGPPISSVAPAC